MPEVRFKESVSIVQFPQGFSEEKRQLDECCDEFLVLASLESDDNWKNDYELVPFKKAMLSDSVVFEISRCGETEVLDNLGDEIFYPKDPLAIGFCFRWQMYLDNYGADIYNIYVVFTIAGISQRYLWGRFNLMPYSLDTAEYTVRIMTTFNSYSKPLNIDFTGSDASGTIRMRGKFGNRQPKTTTESLIDKAYKVEKTVRENRNVYTLETDPLKEIYTRRILDFHFRDGNDFYLSDCNSINHSYQYNDLPVALSQEDSVEMTEQGRVASIKATFTDLVLNQKSYYQR